MYYQSLIRLAIMAFFFVCSGASLAATLVYERVYSHFERGNNTLRITLDERGQMTVERPSFMTHPGQYQIQVDPLWYQQFSARLRAVPVTTAQLQIEYQRRVAEQSFYISHPELSRFEWLDASRNVIDALEIESMDAQRLLAPEDISLQQAAGLEQQWWSLMNEALAEVVEGDVR